MSPRLFIPTEDKETILRALNNHKGDDHIRAQQAFSRYSPEEMREEHGNSGRTRQEILDKCLAHVARVNRAINWVETHLMLLLLILLPSMSFAADTPPAELPASVTRLVDRYDKAVASALEALVRDLAKEETAVTKKGDLDAALAIRALREKYDGQRKSADEAAMLGEAAAPPPTIQVEVGPPAGLVPANGPAFFNRPYRFVDLPPMFAGWLIAQQGGNAHVSQRVQASGPVRFYVLSIDGALTAPRMSKTSMTCSTNDPNRELYTIYEVDYRGGVFVAPTSGSFSGALLLLPPGAEVSK